MVYQWEMEKIKDWSTDEIKKIVYGLPSLRVNRFPDVFQ